MKYDENSFFSSILRANGDHVRLEERRGHASQEPESDDPKRIPHKESDNHMSDQIQLARWVTLVNYLNSIFQSIAPFFIYIYIYCILLTLRPLTFNNLVFSSHPYYNMAHTRVYERVLIFVCIGVAILLHYLQTNTTKLRDLHEAINHMEFHFIHSAWTNSGLGWTARLVSIPATLKLNSFCASYKNHDYCLPLFAKWGWQLHWNDVPNQERLFCNPY